MYTLYEGRLSPVVGSRRMDERLRASNGIWRRRNNVNPITGGGVGSTARRLMPMVVALGTLLMGGWFMAHTAPGHIPDIWAHVYRIVGITNGDTLARPVESQSYLHSTTGNVGGYVDQEWIDFSLEYYDGYDPAVVKPETLVYDGRDGADVPCNNAAVNSPVAYAPQLVGFLVGKAFGLSPLATYHCAEALMLVVSTLLGAVSVMLLPKWRIVCGLVMLCPLMLRYNSFAISADSFTQAMVFLLSCMVFRAFLRKVSTAYCVALAAVCVAVVMCKFIYGPLCLLTLLIPWAQHRLSTAARTDGVGDAVGAMADEVSPDVPLHRDPHMWILAIGDALAIGWLMVWMKLTGWFVTTPLMVSYEEMTARKTALLTDPDTMLSALKAVFASIVQAKSNLDRPIDSLVIRLCWILMLAVLVAVLAASVLRAFERSMSAFCWGTTVMSFGIVMLMYVALWLQYTPTDASAVEGMQHRYFLPLTVLCTLCTCECLQAIAARLRR